MGVTEGPCSTLLLLSLSPSKYCQAVNLGEMILGGTQESNQITLDDKLITSQEDLEWMNMVQRSAQQSFI